MMKGSLLRVLGGFPGPFPTKGSQHLPPGAFKEVQPRQTTAAIGQGSRVRPLTSPDSSPLTRASPQGHISPPPPGGGHLACVVRPRRRCGVGHSTRQNGTEGFWDVYGTTLLHCRFVLASAMVVLDTGPAKAILDPKRECVIAPYLFIAITRKLK